MALSMILMQLSCLVAMCFKVGFPYTNIVAVFGCIPILMVLWL